MNKLSMISASMVAAYCVMAWSPAHAQSGSTCDRPTCAAAAVDKYAARLDLAWTSDATTAEQREKMRSLIEAARQTGPIYWEKIAGEYFAWRNGTPYTLVEHKPFVEVEAERQAQLRKIAESGVLSSLVDPESAKIEWPYAFADSSWKPDLFEKRIKGWVTCGIVNAKNRMGGYSGRSYFSVVVADDTVRHLSVDSAGQGLNELLCQKAKFRSAE